MSNRFRTGSMRLLPTAGCELEVVEMADVVDDQGARSRCGTGGGRSFHAIALSTWSCGRTHTGSFSVAPTVPRGQLRRAYPPSPAPAPHAPQTPRRPTRLTLDATPGGPRPTTRCGRHAPNSRPTVSSLSSICSDTQLLTRSAKPDRITTPILVIRQKRARRPNEYFRPTVS